jgi:hypothetical protein
VRFDKGVHYLHPPRGPGRGRYLVSDAARRARKLNLSKVRLRSERESRVIKLLIWQSYLDDSNSFSQRGSCPSAWRLSVLRLQSSKAIVQSPGCIRQRGTRHTRRLGGSTALHCQAPGARAGPARTRAILTFREAPRNEHRRGHRRDVAHCATGAAEESTLGWASRLSSLPVCW